MMTNKYSDIYNEKNKNANNDDVNDKNLMTKTMIAVIMQELVTTIATVVLLT